MSTIIDAVLMWVYVVSGYRYASVTIYGRCINHIVESSRIFFIIFAWCFGLSCAVVTYRLCVTSRGGP